ncbi:DMT family transporter [uncultured Amnibacterium sp.]|uniref:DMT family transporter n=1 Tax=uncultured Amnibacterium sp. TaxID=1631851 RepID=UPI0035CCA702
MSRRGILLFAALGIAWGIPYLLIKVAVQEVDPAFVVLGRSALGAIVLLPLVIARRQVLPVLRRWRPLLAYSVAEIIVPWYFLSSAETRLPSSTAGLLLAAVPLVGVAVAFLTGRPERMTGTNWLGVLAGTVGVAALVGLDVAGSDLIGVAEMAIVIVGYAIGPVILARHTADLPGTGVVALSLGITAVVYVPLVTLLGSWPTEVPSPAAIGSIVTLAVVCSAAAFVILFALIAEMGPVRVTTITYVNPAVAIVAGALVLHERVTVWTLVGFALVLTGSFLVSRRRRSVAAAAT